MKSFNARILQAQAESFLHVQIMKFILKIAFYAFYLEDYFLPLQISNSSRNFPIQFFL